MEYPTSKICAEGMGLGTVNNSPSVVAPWLPRNRHIHVHPYCHQFHLKLPRTHQVRSARIKPSAMRCKPGYRTVSRSVRGPSGRLR